MTRAITIRVITVVIITNVIALTIPMAGQTLQTTNQTVNRKTLPYKEPILVCFKVASFLTFYSAGNSIQSFHKTTTGPLSDLNKVGTLTLQMVLNRLPILPIHTRLATTL